MIFEGLGVHPHSPPRPSVKSLPIEFGTSDALPSTQAVVKEETAVLGQPLKRVEDPKFITGTGLFADDIALPEVLHSVFVRSLYAHARIKRVDVTEALKQPAVRLVLTGQDLLNR
ncbi:MAG: xanthine dehydrogenase family protein molybdopterin-binding subunit, partial [Thaumarchaeota archaeon]